MSKFPCGRSGRQQLEFHPAPFRAPLRAFASLVFPWQEDSILLCRISDRGWCIPSGRVEPAETSQEAALREAVEEAGAILNPIVYIGCYRITERSEVRWADVYAASVEGLVDLDPQFESTGRRFVTLEQVPDIYYVWNDLTEAVFVHSRETLRRHLSFLSN
ncbi:MAG: NUDIX domain-containing protein [Fimbriimonadaceae bacterium]|nr:NUDIX domain-containing protein [Fimbriimonadaceae bacterium]